MTLIFIDTSGAIALNHQNDRHHLRARQWYQAIRAEQLRLLTTTAILAEIGDGFAGRGRWHIAAQFIRAALADPRMAIVGVDRELIDRAVRLCDQRPDKAWSLTDCIRFAVMAERGVQAALTADDDFRQAGFRALPYEPVGTVRSLT